MVQSNSTLAANPQLNYYLIALRAIFGIIIYACIVYRSEALLKLAHTAEESTEKAFARWNSIFDTFPEGVCIIKND